MDELSPARKAILFVVLLTAVIQGMTPDAGDLASCALLRIADAVDLAASRIPRDDSGDDTSDQVCTPLRVSRDELAVPLPRSRSSVACLPLAPRPCLVPVSSSIPEISTRAAQTSASLEHVRLIC